MRPRKTISVIHEKEDDNRILSLKKFRGIKIVSPAEFLELLIAVNHQ